MAPPALAASGLPSGTCSGDPSAARALNLEVSGQPSRGLYALPSGPPTALVVFAHGYSHRAEGWAPRLSKVAAQDGALTVVMNYRGLLDLPPDAGGVPRSRGFPVKAGGEDLNAAALAMLAACPSIRNVVLMGVSMGGASSGMALAAKPKRVNGSPLYDYWLGVEGVFNLTELYFGSVAAAQISEFAANAKTDIEAETGGTRVTEPAAYAERTIVFRAADVAAAGLKGVVLVHGVEDGLAPYDNGSQMTGLLRGGGVPTDFYTVTRRGAGDDPDTTLLGYAGQTSGLAGHGGEISEKHAVIDTAMARLHALLTTTQPAPCNRNFVYDGLPRTTSPDPAATSSGCKAATPLSATAAGGPTGAPAACTSRPVITLGRPKVTVTRGPPDPLSGSVRATLCGAEATSRLRIDTAISRTLGKGRCQVRARRAASAVPSGAPGAGRCAP